MNELSKDAAKKFGRNNVFRLIIVARSFDAIFYDAEGIERELSKLRLGVPIDILSESQRGYSLLRVSSSV